MKMKIEKLATPIVMMDIKCPTLKYAVLGPDGEDQKFFTLKNAKQYASIRRQSTSSHEAIKKYARS